MTAAGAMRVSDAAGAMRNVSKLEQWKSNPAALIRREVAERYLTSMVIFFDATTG